MKKRQLRWMRLDNAAKLFPASRRRGWNNIFRLSVTLDEEIRPEVLQKALESIIPRFPSIAVRVRRGVFWYYLEEIDSPPKVIRDLCCPLTHMPFDDIMKCAFRVLYYKRRIAVEFFHSITDGNGGLIFLKTLAAEYLRLSGGYEIPCEQGVFDIHEPPREEELADDFPRFAGKYSLSGKAPRAFQLSGTPEKYLISNLLIAELETPEVLKLARSYGASLTEFMAAVMLSAYIDLQAERVPEKKRRPVRVFIPTNLRRVFPSVTLRNFILYVTPGVDPRLCDYTLEQLIAEVHGQMSLELKPEKMAARIRANVRLEQIPIVRVLPVFIKDAVMSAVSADSEKQTCITISNLGLVKLPEEMARHVERFGFTLNVKRTAPNNCAMISYGDKLYIEMIRSIREPVLERKFLLKLRELGLHIKVESNYGSADERRV